MPTLKKLFATTLQRTLVSIASEELQPVILARVARSVGGAVIGQALEYDHVQVRSWPTLDSGYCKQSKHVSETCSGTGLGPID